MKRAFTLIELLVYMALMSMFLIVLSNILATALETLTESTRATIIDVDSRFILNRLAYDVGRAASITTPAVAGQTSNSLVLSVGTYQVSDGNLQLGTDRLNSIGTVVQNFSVTRVGNGVNNDTVRIGFDLVAGNKTRSLSTALGLR